MDPRPRQADPLAAAAADLELLESDGSLPPEEQVEVFGRLHTALAAALASAGTERPGPAGPGAGR